MVRNVGGGHMTEMIITTNPTTETFVTIIQTVIDIILRWIIIIGTYFIK